MLPVGGRSMRRLMNVWIGKMTNRIDARITVRELHPYGSSFDLLGQSTSPSSMCLSPQSRHSKMNRSGNPPKRVVRRMSCIGCAQRGQRGGLGAGFPANSFHMIRRPTR
jgi:hypothetical protein